MLDLGSKAPAFTVQDEEGHTVDLESFRGSWVVLWWYPKAETAG